MGHQPLVTPDPYMLSSCDVHLSKEKTRLANPCVERIHVLTNDLLYARLAKDKKRGRDRTRYSATSRKAGGTQCAQRLSPIQTIQRVTYNATAASAAVLLLTSTSP